MNVNKWSKTYWSDLAERVGSTFLGALLAMLTLAGTTPVDWTDAKAVWAVLGVPTVASLLKGVLANLGNAETGASALPTNDGPQVPEAFEYGPRY